VFSDRHELNEELGEKHYHTRTHGIRKIAPARAAAEGICGVASFLKLPRELVREPPFAGK
jgi:hypothetical protein